MVTQLTDRVAKGEIKTFEEFALECTKNFSISRYYYNPDVVPEEICMNPYYSDNFDKCRQALEDFKNNIPTKEDAEKAYLKYSTDFDNDCKKYYESNKQRLKRCENMLECVNNWEIPSDEYYYLKKYMVKTLQETIESCKNSMEFAQTHKKKDKDEFIIKFLAGTELIENYNKAYTNLCEEQVRSNSANEWLQNLKKSLKNINYAK